ncbi:hypothetical protein BsWGS_08172 [Bradybaena similaris]
MVSVGLNIFLLASRNPDTTESKRSAVLTSRSDLTSMTRNSQDPMHAPLPPPGLDLNRQRSRESKLVRRATSSQSGTELVKSINKSSLLERGRNGSKLDKSINKSSLLERGRNGSELVKSINKSKLHEKDRSGTELVKSINKSSLLERGRNGFELDKSINKSRLHERGQKSQVPRNAPSTHLRMPLCPLNPPGLVGLSKPFLGKTDFKTIRSLFPGMEKGGRIKPANCTARQRLAVIIPFRNRHTHLTILLRNLIPFLQKQMADATIFVIEQAPPSTFNRGALLNIGFLEALKTSDFGCFILHDVDLIPLNDRNFYRCGDSPHHYASAINKHRFKLVYETYFGGVVGFSKEQYIKVNGNSNLYFGWGGEDDDLALRTLNKNYTLHRHDNVTSRYFMVRHSRDKGNDKNLQRGRIIKSASQRQDVEGLNTIKYKVKSIKLEPLFTWVNVSLDMKDILDTAPEYTKNDMWRLLKMVRDGEIQ